MKAKAPENSFHPKTRAEWRAWLRVNHARTQGIWVITYKKSSGMGGPQYADLVEEALCFGWIDSKPGKLDEARTMLWCAPRKQGSVWSLLNRERVARLIAAKKMTAPGLAKVEASRRDGSWSVLESVEAMEIPADLAAAFSRYPSSAANFDAFPASAKKGILQWIQSAKRAETRAARVAETATLAAKNVRANQWRPK